MRTLLFKWLTAIFAVMLISSFVSMMAAFVGSEGGSRLRQLPSVRRERRCIGQRQVNPLAGHEDQGGSSGTRRRDGCLAS